jgi:hypothetical protein
METKTGARRLVRRNATPLLFINHRLVQIILDALRCL